MCLEVTLLGDSKSRIRPGFPMTSSDAQIGCVCIQSEIHSFIVAKVSSEPVVQKYGFRFKIASNSLSLTSRGQRNGSSLRCVDSYIRDIELTEINDLHLSSILKSSKCLEAILKRPLLSSNRISDFQGQTPSTP